MSNRVDGDKIIKDEFGTSLLRPMIWCDKCGKYIRVWGKKTQRLSSHFAIIDKRKHFLPMIFCKDIHIKFM